MTVLIRIKKNNQEYCWEKLSDQEKAELRKELNDQTAKVLGYERS